MIAVIGAGIAGLAAAATLRDAGHTVRVLEKSRGLGGRLATRRGPQGRFDHGAQYASVRDPAFAAYADRAREAGACADWDIDGSKTRRIVGLPGMSGLVAPLAEGLDIVRERRVTGLAREAKGIRLAFEDGGSSARFASVVCAVPAPQAQALLEPHGAPFDRLGEAVVAPCWSLMLTFEGRPDLPKTKRFDGAGPLGWLASESAKPGRRDDREAGERWVVHAAPDWSRRHLEDAPDAVAEALLAALADEAGAALPDIAHRAAHRWRYAQVETALGTPCLLSEDGRLGYCGDACLGGRVEAAYLSGVALGRTMSARMVNTR